uniref:L1 transposable element RRM domain-containing protein n=1 Tax=Anolis carolinensis TaxID=28377 RepID=A0A803TTF1_ANOCA
FPKNQKKTPKNPPQYRSSNNRHSTPYSQNSHLQKQINYYLRPRPSDRSLERAQAKVAENQADSQETNKDKMATAQKAGRKEPGEGECPSTNVNNEILQQIKGLQDLILNSTQEITSKISGLENQIKNLRMNIRIRNLPEINGENPGILKREMIKWIKEISQTDCEESWFERIHRVGYKTNTPFPRDILVRFGNFYYKDKIMKVLRGQVSQLKYQGTLIQIFPDLCPETLGEERCSNRRRRLTWTNMD